MKTMKKKKLAVIGIAGVAGMLSATAPASAQTFYQCMPVKCKAGEYVSGSSCARCTGGYYCPGDNKRYACTGEWEYAEPGSSKCSTFGPSDVRIWVGGGCANIDINDQALMSKLVPITSFSTKKENGQTKYITNFSILSGRNKYYRSGFFNCLDNNFKEQYTSQEEYTSQEAWCKYTAISVLTTPNAGGSSDFTVKQYSKVYGTLEFQSSFECLRLGPGGGGCANKCNN